MGTYVYRATAKKVKLSDGRVAHLAKYAYKPFWGYDDYSVNANAQMMRKSGCYASERMEKNGNYTGLVVQEDEPGAQVYKSRSPVFYDTIFDDEHKVDGVTVAETGKKKIYVVDWYEDEDAAEHWETRDTFISATNREAAKQQFLNTPWVVAQYPTALVVSVNPKKEAT